MYIYTYTQICVYTHVYIYVYIHRYAYIILDNQFRSLDSTSAIFLYRYYNVTVLYSLKYK